MLNCELRLHKENTTLKSTIDIAGLIKPRDIAVYRFDLSDTMGTTRPKFSWASTGTETINTPPGLSEKGVNYNYVSTPNPSGDSTAEKRFTFTGMREFCVKLRFHVPSNYFHRAVLNISITGDITSWVVGDTVRAADGTSTGTIYYKNGQSIFLLFAANNLVGPGVWTGNVTNLTRSSTLASTRVGNEASNNKLFALWCDGYSTAGGSPSIAWEMHSDGAGGSKLYYHFGANNQVVGTLINSTSADVEFIRPSDVNKWFDIILYVKMGSSENTEDGIIRTWFKREGESSYTQVFNQINAQIAPRISGGNAIFSNGYCHGWSNSGFAESTTIRDSVFILNTRSIDGVNL